MSPFHTSTIRRTCPVCGKPIGAQGVIHLSCYPEGDIIRWYQSLWVCADRAVEKMRREMEPRVKRWSKGMDIEERDRLFPDMKGRK